VTTEHPNYGTCTGCTQSKGVKTNGRIKRHNRTNGYGSWQMTVECPGSDRPYAEQNREQWDAGQGRWKEMPLEVEATLHVDGKEQPHIVEVHPFPDVKAGHKLFGERSMTLHLHLLERGGYANTFRVELRDAEGTIVNSEQERDDGGLNGLTLRWMADLAKDTADASGGAR
jgi:hypothetical protein